MSSNLQTQLERALERLLGPRDALDADTRPLLKALIAVACAADYTAIDVMGKTGTARVPLKNFLEQRNALEQLRALLSEGE